MAFVAAVANAVDVAVPAAVANAAAVAVSAAVADAVLWRTLLMWLYCI